MAKLKEAPKPKVSVVQNPVDPVSVEILATAIRDVAQGISQAMQAGLNRHALVTLIKEQTKLSARDINEVLTALECLEQTYCLPRRRA